MPSNEDKPLFEDPFGDKMESKPKKEQPKRKESKLSGGEVPSHKCAPGQTPVKGFTRKDGKKVAPFCSTKRAPKLTLSGMVVMPPVENKKQLSKLADELGCEDVAKKLDALSSLSKDEGVKKKAKEQAEWLRNQPSCKIKRDGDKKEEPKAVEPKEKS